MDKKRAVINKLDSLFWGLDYAENHRQSVEVRELIMSLKRAENKPALRAWATKARRVIGEINA